MLEILLYCNEREEIELFDMFYTYINFVNAGIVRWLGKHTSGLELDLLVFVVDKHTESAVPVLATEVWPALCQQLHHQAGERHVHPAQKLRLSRGLQGGESGAHFYGI